ncbi:hypothetical protein HHL22_00420 [Hymenobacter sp. RP-2-7]|uniref:Uncharacterized protein n=1 Tax=Hymenobacter polaris TaxID=2682546 RepID=A0A7Y0AAA9_9BACT|nr:hypothetical protein [Hymenobacter polaris]NML63664.1 hypothetical protein [Hymenobacter polaris]
MRHVLIILPAVLFRNKYFPGTAAQTTLFVTMATAAPAGTIAQPGA